MIERLSGSEADSGVLGYAINFERYGPLLASIMEQNAETIEQLDEETDVEEMSEMMTACSEHYGHVRMTVNLLATGIEVRSTMQFAD